MQILNSIDNDLIMMCEPIITLEPNENIDTFNRLAIQNRSEERRVGKEC